MVGLARLDTGFGDLEDRMFVDIDEVDVRSVVGVEVVGVDQYSLRTERVIERHQLLGHLRIFHRLADLVPDEFAGVLGRLELRP